MQILGTRNSTQPQKIIAINSDTTIDASYFNCKVICNPGSAYTITLPTSLLSGNAQAYIDFEFSNSITENVVITSPSLISRYESIAFGHNESARITVNRSEDSYILSDSWLIPADLSIKLSGPIGPLTANTQHLIPYDTTSGGGFNPLETYTTLFARSNVRGLPGYYRWTATLQLQPTAFDVKLLLLYERGGSPVGVNSFAYQPSGDFPVTISAEYFGYFDGLASPDTDLKVYLAQFNSGDLDVTINEGSLIAQRVSRNAP